MLLGLTSIARVVLPAPGPLEWLSLVFVAVAGGAAIFHARAVGSLEARRGAEAASFARILSGLSRSVSADAIVDAILEELGEATGADHIVVVRRRPTARVLEARLVSARPEVSDSTTLLPIADLEDPLRPSDRVARPAPFREEVDELVEIAPVRQPGQGVGRGARFGLLCEYARDRAADASIAAPVRMRAVDSGQRLPARRARTIAPMTPDSIVSGAARE